jgi:thiol-disulfide isomerase/thioredoxin
LKIGKHLINIKIKNQKPLIERGFPMEKKMKIFYYLVFFLIFITNYLHSISLPTQWEVYGSDNQSLSISHIFIDNLNIIPSDTTIYQVPSNSKINISLPSNGYYFIRVSGGNHKPIEFYYYLDTAFSNSNIIQIKLEPITMEINEPDLKITGNFNNYTYSPMLKVSDSVYEFEIQSNLDTIEYEIMGITKNEHSVNGTMADGYRLDGAGDYYSQIFNHKGDKNHKIILDLNKYSSPSNPNVNFNNEYQKEYYETQKFKYFSFDQPQKVSPITFRDTLYTILDNLKELYLSSTFEPTKKLLANKYLIYNAVGYSYNFIKILGIKLLPFESDKEFIQHLLYFLQPTDPSWCLYKFDGGTIFISSLIAFNDYKNEYFNSFLNSCNNQDIIKKELENAIGYYTEAKPDLEKVEYFYRYYISLFPNTHRTFEIEKILKKQAKLSVGSIIPAFKVKSYNSDVYITEKDLMGKYTLIDVWATWCGPCVKNIPNIIDAYDKYKYESFQILSISLDDNIEKLEAFFNRNYIFPWLNAIEPSGLNSKLAKKWEFNGVPVLLLVGPGLRILATDVELRGDNLFKTIDKYLQK